MIFFRFVISLSSLEVYHMKVMKPSVVKSNLGSGKKKKKQQDRTTIVYNVRVANNNLRYNLPLPGRRKFVLIANTDCFASS